MNDKITSTQKRTSPIKIKVGRAASAGLRNAVAYLNANSLNEDIKATINPIKSPSFNLEGDTSKFC